MKKLLKEIKKESKEYFLATRDVDKAFLVYESEHFRLSEIDLIHLIKICVIEKRSKAIGNKLIEIYKDSTVERGWITEQRLRMIGIYDGKHEPTKSNAKRR